MSKPNPIFDDIAKMATGAASSMLEMRHEVERIVQDKFENLADKLNLVKRDEFEVVREMAQKAREENIALRKEIDALKKPTKKVLVKKPVAKKTTTKKPNTKKAK